MTKSLLSALAVAALVSCGGGEPPDDLHPRVIQSRGKFVREVFLIKEIPNLITDLRICNGKIIATGGTASCDVSAPSEVQCIHYRPELRDPFAVISPSRCERIIVGHEWNGGPVVAVAQTGAVLWTRKFDVAPGPLALVHAADGLRVAVILGRSKLALLDLQSSASIREIAGEFSGFIGSGNLAGDDNDEIVTESSSGIDIRRSDGAILSHRSVEGSVAVTRSGSGKAHIVALFERSLLLLSAENEVTTRLDLPDLPTLSVMYVAAAAEFGSPRQIATLIKGRGGWHRTLLLVHNDLGQLLHAEILDDDYVSAIPDQVHAGAAFLIGGRGRMIRFAAP